MRQLLVLIAIVSLVFLWATSSNAAGRCFPRDKLVTALGKKYKETRQGIGLSRGRSVIEFYTSESGTFTLSVTDVRGVSCIIAAGQGWEKIAAPLPPAY